MNDENRPPVEVIPSDHESSDLGCGLENVNDRNNTLDESQDGDPYQRHNSREEEIQLPSRKDKKSFFKTLKNKLSRRSARKTENSRSQQGECHPRKNDSIRRGEINPNHAALLKNQNRQLSSTTTAAFRYHDSDTMRPYQPRKSSGMVSDRTDLPSLQMNSTGSSTGDSTSVRTGNTTSSLENSQNLTELELYGAYSDSNNGTSPGLNQTNNKQTTSALSQCNLSNTVQVSTPSHLAARSSSILATFQGNIDPKSDPYGDMAPDIPLYDQVTNAMTQEWSLTRELFRLSKYGWYWGPITRLEAEEKLLDQPDGSFLVRDSSDERYLLSLSFRSYGKTLHTRIEHCNSVFSFYAQPESEGYNSIVELIESSINDSQTGIFCYSRSRNPGSPSFPVRLTKPVSRFSQVRTLQYMCRFVIRQYTRFDHIQKLPLPNKIKEWLEENQY